MNAFGCALHDGGEVLTNADLMKRLGPLLELVKHESDRNEIATALRFSSEGTMQEWGAESLPEDRCTLGVDVSANTIDVRRRTMKMEYGLLKGRYERLCMTNGRGKNCDVLQGATSMRGYFSADSVRSQVSKNEGLVLATDFLKGRTPLEKVQEMMRRALGI